MNTIAHSRFNVFHDENPEVTRCSAASPWKPSERDRTARRPSSSGSAGNPSSWSGKPFKITNSLTVYHARLFIADHPIIMPGSSVSGRARRSRVRSPCSGEPRRRKARLGDGAVQGEPSRGPASRPPPVQRRRVDRVGCWKPPTPRRVCRRWDMTPLGAISSAGLFVW